MLESKSTIRARYAETDMMGVIHHGSYAAWLEVARTDMFRHFGLTYRKLEESGYRLPVLSMEMKYRQPAIYDDDIVITVRLRRRPQLRIKLDYELHRGDTLLATASTEHAFVDHSGHPVRPPEMFANKMAESFNV